MHPKETRLYSRFTVLINVEVGGHRGGSLGSGKKRGGLRKAANSTNATVDVAVRVVDSIISALPIPRTRWCGSKEIRESTAACFSSTSSPGQSSAGGSQSRSIQAPSLTLPGISKASSPKHTHGSKGQESETPRSVLKSIKANRARASLLRCAERRSCSCVRGVLTP